MTYLKLEIVKIAHILLYTMFLRNHRGMKYVVLYQILLLTVIIKMQ